MTDPRRPGEPAEPVESAKPPVSPPASPASPASAASPVAPASTAPLVYGPASTSGAGAVPPDQVASAKPSRVLSIIALVAGIFGIVASIVPIPYVSGVPSVLACVVAVAMGFVARRKEPAAKGMWLTGIILGFTGIALAVIGLIFVMLFLGGAFPSSWY